MTWIDNTLRQTATLWTVSSVDAYNDPTWATPVSLAPTNSNKGVRWEHRSERFINAQGDEDHSRAVIYSLYQAAVGDWLYLGASTEADPEDVTGADQIRHVSEVPDQRARWTLYRYML